MAPPDTIGPYQVLSELGRGGMGIVYKGRAPDGGEVAIKVLRGKGKPTPQQRTRFEREARALAKLAHPSVVRLLDFGEQAGEPYLVTEFLAGGTLQERLETRGWTSPEEAATLGVALAQGLAAAHALGVLHRDLKPENVLLEPDGGARLNDFGLVKDLSRLEETEALTRTGALLGTPGFWAPEQARGKKIDFGPPVDVYGLGAVLYACLTTHPPIQGATLIEVLVATAEEPPAPIRAIRKDVPERLEAIVLRCLEKDPAERYATAAALGDALEAFLAEAPAPASGLALGLVGLVGLLGLLGLGTLAASAWPPASTPAPPTPSSPPAASPLDHPSPTPSLPADPEYTAGRAALDAGRLEEAHAIFARGVERGSAACMNALGAMSARGIGGPQDEARAERLYRRAIELGDAKAAENLGGLLITDPERAEEGRRLLLRAAASDRPSAMATLGVSLTTGVGGPIDLPAARDLLERSLALEDSPKTRGYLGVTLGQIGEHRLARAHFEIAAKAGNRDAMDNLAYYLRVGRGGPSDPARARSYFRSTADQGSDEGMLRLGQMLARGEGGPKDPAEAFRLLQRAAELGRAAAYLELGKMFEKGEGRPVDLKQAKLNYRAAARRRNTEALEALRRLEGR